MILSRSLIRISSMLFINLFVICIPLQSLPMNTKYVDNPILRRVIKYKTMVVKALETEDLETEDLIIAEILGQIAQESGGRQSVRGKAGEIGLMQLLPSTAALMGVNPYKIDQNVLGGIRYRKHLEETYGFDGKLLLAAYNAGPGNVQKGRFSTRYIKNVQKWTKLILEILDS